MNRSLRNPFAICSVAIVLALGLTSRAASAEEAKGNFEVHDVSLWILEAGATQANTRTAFPSALTGLADSARNAPAVQPQPQGALLNGVNFVVSNNAVATPSPAPTIRKGKIAPINLLTFRGQPAAGLDVDLRTKAGSFLAHWPAGESLPNRLRWSGPPGFDLVEKPTDEAEFAFVDEDGWIHKARQASGLFVKRGARLERFLAYDVELNMSAPIRLEGGPDKFKVINTSNATLYDVLISRGTPQGRRVAWIDVLPKSEGAPSAPTPAAPVRAAKASKDKGDLFDDAKPPPAPKAAPNPAAKPAAAGTTKLFGGLPAASRPAEPPAPKPVPAAYPVAETKKSPQPNEPVAAPAVEKQDSESKSAAAPAKGVEVTLSEPLAAGSEQASGQTTKALAERLARSGLSADEAQGFVERYAGLLFEGDAVVVACRLDGGVLDEKLPLSVFPEPTKIVRVPIVVLRNADPQLTGEVDRLIAQLGDRKFAVREAAQQRLLELGPLAFPALQKSLNEEDLEIVIRAEWLLLNQNQTPNAPAKPAAPAAPARPAKPAAAAAALPNALNQLLSRLKAN